MPAKPTFYDDMARRIATFRRTRSLSQEALAERADIAASYIAHIEMGDRRPTLDVLLAIAAALDVPLWRLLTDERTSAEERVHDATMRELGSHVVHLSTRERDMLLYLAQRMRAASAYAPITRGHSSRAAERKRKR